MHILGRKITKLKWKFFSKKRCKISLIYDLRSHRLPFHFSVKTEMNDEGLYLLELRLIQKSLIFSAVYSWDLGTNSKMFCFFHNFLLDIALIQFYKKHHLFRLCPNSPCKQQKTETNYFQPNLYPTISFEGRY